MSQGDGALNPADAHGTVEATHHEDHVDVGHQRLFALTAGGPAA